MSRKSVFFKKPTELLFSNSKITASEKWFKMIIKLLNFSVRRCEIMFLCHNNAVSISPFFRKSFQNRPFNFPTCLLLFPCTTFTSAIKNPSLFLSSSSRFKLNCRYKDDVPLSASMAFDVLGVNPDCTPDELKSAFRSKVLSNYYCPFLKDLFIYVIY